jgi:hypothetical protein
MTRSGELGSVAAKLGAPIVSTRLKGPETTHAENREAQSCPSHGGPQGEQSSEYGGGEGMTPYALPMTRPAQLKRAARRGGSGGEFGRANLGRTRW